MKTCNQMLQDLYSVALQNIAKCQCKCKVSCGLSISATTVQTARLKIHCGDLAWKMWKVLIDNLNLDQLDYLSRRSSGHTRALSEVSFDVQ